MAANQGRTQDLKFGYSKFEKTIFFCTIVTLLPHRDLNLKIAITPATALL